MERKASFMRTVIDAHVHIVPASALGKENSRFGIKNLPYGYRQKGDEGFQIMPCYMHDSCFSADTLVHMMDVYGVSRAVLQQSLMDEQNEVVAKAVQKYPNRLSGAMVLEPTPGWEDELEHWYASGLRSIKFEMRTYSSSECYPNTSYCDAQMSAFFDAAECKNMTVTIDPAPVNYPIYLPESLEAAVRCHPGVRFVLCHLAYPCPINTAELRSRWEQMLTVAKQPNCWLDLAALPDFFDAEGWPYPTALSLLNYAKERCGADKLIWGTDTPGTLCRATYPQMMAMFEHAGFTQAELDALFAGNAQVAYNL